MSKTKRIQIAPEESIKVHLHYLDHFLRVKQIEEAQSEQRIKFFIALATGIMALISISSKTFLNTYTSGKENIILLLAISAIFLFILCIFGLLVYARVIWSDRNIKKHNKLWRVSFDAINKLDSSLDSYNEMLEQMDDNKIYRPLKIFKGTLTQFIWLTEGILIFSLMMILGIILKCALPGNIIISLSTTTFMLLIFWVWKKHVIHDVEDKSK